MPSSRGDILASLRKALAAGPPFPENLSDNGPRLPVTMLAPGEDLRARFVAEVKRVRGIVHGARDQADARAILGGLLAERKITRLTMWDQTHLPVDDVEGLLETQGITRVQGETVLVETAEAGITACDAAIAATGTLVLTTGPGRSRMASLLPPLHIALVREAQLLPRLEDWVASRYANKLQDFRTASNITLITGSSRTSDIEMIPVFGVHGPLEFHVILMSS